MRFSVGVEYAMHCLLYMTDSPSGKAFGIKVMQLKMKYHL